jgi:hypothetical protein
VDLAWFNTTRPRSIPRIGRIRKFEQGPQWLSGPAHKFYPYTYYGTELSAEKQDWWAGLCTNGEVVFCFPIAQCLLVHIGGLQPPKSTRLTFEVEIV